MAGQAEAVNIGFLKKPIYDKNDSESKKIPAALPGSEGDVIVENGIMAYQKESNYFSGGGAGGNIHKSKLKLDEISTADAGEQMNGGSATEGTMSQMERRVLLDVVGDDSEDLEAQLNRNPELLRENGLLTSNSTKPEPGHITNDSDSRKTNSFSETFEPEPVWKISKGRELLEILGVYVDKNPRNLCGILTAYDGDTHVIQIERWSSLPDENGYEAILLNGLKAAIWTADGLTVFLDLWEKEDAAPFPLYEFRPYMFEWSGSDLSRPNYDERISEKVKTKYGKMSVTFVVLSDGAEALVEVILIRSESTKHPAYVSGSITAQSTVYNKIHLFEKSENERIEVCDGKAIPLSRSVLAVPLGSDLTIHADLWAHGRQLVCGNLSFLAEIPKSTEASIESVDGEIRVRVTYM